MSRSKRSRTKSHPSAAQHGASAVAVKQSQPTDTRARLGILVVAIVLAVVAVIGADFVFGAIAGNGGASPSLAASPSGAPTAGATQLGVVVQGNGGHWTNVSPDQLAEMLDHKDFTLVNVKTPYSGEIDGTDLYIPYDQLAARASELPSDKT
ncbi:MAG: hypothetical protein ABSB75_05810, partial [Candidatus Limnocylindrales bacterium]